MENQDTIVLSSLKHIIKQTKDFEGERTRFSSKTPFGIFQQLLESVCLCTLCMCVCAGEEQRTQDTLRWPADFESSAGDCPVQTILWEEIFF